MNIIEKAESDIKSLEEEASHNMHVANDAIEEIRRLKNRIVELENACRMLLSLDTERCMSDVPRERWESVREKAEHVLGNPPKKS